MAVFIIAEAGVNHNGDVNIAKKLVDIGPKIEFQDESLTSVIAEQQLISYKKPYTKGDIDAQAAAIILQDYIESHYAG